jgi:hypothetical protein
MQTLIQYVSLFFSEVETKFKRTMSTLLMEMNKDGKTKSNNGNDDSQPLANLRYHSLQSVIILKIL